jgi:hypothetical protein
MSFQVNIPPVKVLALPLIGIARYDLLCVSLKVDFLQTYPVKIENRNVVLFFSLEGLPIFERKTVEVGLFYFVFFSKCY